MKEVAASWRAFAALLTGCDLLPFEGDCSDAEGQLNAKQLRGTWQAFAAILGDGSVVGVQLTREVTAAPPRAS